MTDRQIQKIFFFDKRSFSLGGLLPIKMANTFLEGFLGKFNRGKYFPALFAWGVFTEVVEGGNVDITYAYTKQGDGQPLLNFEGPPQMLYRGREEALLLGENGHLCLDEGQQHAKGVAGSFRFDFFVDGVPSLPEEVQS